ncbi:phosphatidylglycerol lysyltransferase domain-containing protein [Aliiroseovarius lamellibrachiae]|uniref:phosphatidylglycerol lysyltransferase domain-containing protein n=1 Tax=Aliiroseovarius lamellibrachiae TaxID=1924933 RepID=UPI001BE01AA2|nr:phosphatidylglycerol lysyltransferase domain-containing protein [Aliiroseovarius lamellibrachiae]MBT2132176.1 lysylphosphatidylglycerol synthetase family protein [Aliiroseovarius lamellibrachiae]
MHQGRFRGIGRERLAERRFSNVLPHAGGDGIDLRKMLARQILPLAFALGIVWLLWGKMDDLDVNHIKTSLKTVAPHQWLLAAFFSAISFWALGRYDRVVHRLIGSPTQSGAAQRAGVTAIALSQTVGMGVLSSALVRWRMLSEISLLQATRISMIVSVSFLTAWAVVAAGVVLLVPLNLPGSTWIACAVLAGATALVAFSVFRPNFLSRFNLPSVKAMAAFVALAAIDTFAAGAALWAVMPENCVIGLVPLVAAYLIALGAGLLSGTPGGVGPFEVTLLALLPQLDQEPVLAAILAFRAVYYAAPALIAAALTIRGPANDAAPDTQRTGAQLTELTHTSLLPSRVSAAIDAAPRAESALLRQGCLSLFETHDRCPTAMAKKTGQSLVVVSDPLKQAHFHTGFLSDLTQASHNNYLSPFLYKIGGRMAAIARNAHWVTLPVAREAWISPQIFSTDGSSRRQLRRKLRHAEKSGVYVKVGGANLPLLEMARISDDWRRARGAERGFSMGVWRPDTLPHSQIYLAYQNDNLVGFITLHKNAREYGLDLMRMKEDTPDGTMHLLVSFAIEHAAKQGCKRLSLAAVPLGPKPGEPKIFHYLRHTLDKISGASGLRQFKTSFAPNWETLYVSAPTRLGLLLGALDVTREISRPHVTGCNTTNRQSPEG